MATSPLIDAAIWLPLRRPHPKPSSPLATPWVAAPKAERTERDGAGGELSAWYEERADERRRVHAGLRSKLTGGALGIPYPLAPRRSGYGGGAGRLRRGGTRVVGDGRPLYGHDTPARPLLPRASHCLLVVDAATRPH